MRKKEDPAKVAKRVKRYYENPNRVRFEIIGATPDEKESFSNMKGLESVTSANKMRILMKVWSLHYEEIAEQIIDVQKKNSEPNNLIIKGYRIINTELVKFIQDNKLSVETITSKSGYLKEAGITFCFLEAYLIFLKELCETKKTKNLTNVFPDILSDKKNIEVFLQKVEAEKRKYEQEKALKE